MFAYFYLNVQKYETEAKIILKKTVVWISKKKSLKIHVYEHCFCVYKLNTKLIEI